jgi:hypothetical protein
MSDEPLPTTISFEEAEELSTVAWEVEWDGYEQLHVEACEEIKAAHGDEALLAAAVAKLDQAVTGWESIVKRIGVEVQQGNN